MEYNTSFYLPGSSIRCKWNLGRVVSTVTHKYTVRLHSLINTWMKVNWRNEENWNYGTGNRSKKKGKSRNEEGQEELLFVGEGTQYFFWNGLEIIRTRTCETWFKVSSVVHHWFPKRVGFSLEVEIARVLLKTRSTIILGKSYTKYLLTRTGTLTVVLRHPTHLLP